MLSPQVDATNLANLPSDIIRLLIRLAREEVDMRKLISPRWNALVLEHLADRKCLPVIKSCLWRVSPSGNLTLKVAFPQRFRHYFGVLIWLSQPIFHDKFYDSADRMYECVDGEHILPRSIDHVLGRCSRILKLDLDMDINLRINEMEMILAATEGAKFDELTVPILAGYGKKSVSKIITIIRTRSVQRLILTTSSYRRFHVIFNHCPFGALFRVASSLGCAVELRLVEARKRRWSQNMTYAHWEKKKEVLNRKWNVNGEFEVIFLDYWSVRFSIIVPVSMP